MWFGVVHSAHFTCSLRDRPIPAGTTFPTGPLEHNQWCLLVRLAKLWDSSQVLPRGESWATQMRLNLTPFLHQETGNFVYCRLSWFDEDLIDAAFILPT